jgi:hypothetical protein
MEPGSTMTNRKGFLDEAVVLARFGAISLRSFGLSASGLADRKQFEKHETAGNAQLRRTRVKKIMSDNIIHDHNDADIDRQAFLKSMAGARTGAFCVLKGGVLKAFSPATIRHDASSTKGSLSSVRLSDNHVGFNQLTNPDVIACLRNWLMQEQTIQDQVMLETAEPGGHRVTGNIQ